MEGFYPSVCRKKCIWIVEASVKTKEKKDFTPTVFVALRLSCGLGIILKQWFSAFFNPMPPVAYNNIKTFLCV